MKRKNLTKRLVSSALCTVMLASLVTGCGSKETGAQSGGTESGSGDGDVTTIDVYDQGANFQGIQSGWYAKLVKDKFNLELNIISPIVSGGGDSLYETRSAAGDLGDLIFVSANDNRAQDLVDAGLVMDMTPYMEGEENLSTYQSAIDAANKNCVTQEGTYLIPSEVTVQSGTTPCESGGEMNTGVYLRWDLYKELGYPQMSTMEDMLGVLKDMQDMCTESDSGQKVYAFSFFKDWDDVYMTAAMQGFSYYGYGMENYCLFQPDGSEYVDAISDNSPYIRTLKMFYEANQMGLIDPESTTQDYDTLYTKYQDGAVLYSPWAWQGKNAYNTTEHTSQGKAMEFVPVDDNVIYSYGCYPEGNANQNCVMIGKNAKDPQKLMDFIDWMYSPEGIEASMYGAGPKGLTWDLDESGNPVLTDYGKEALLGDPTEAMVDDVEGDWGTGSYKDGQNWLNYKAVAPTEIDPSTGYAYDYSMWNSVQQERSTDIEKDWQAKLGFNTTKEYLVDADKIAVAPGISAIAPTDSSDIAAIRSQCKSIIVEKSWQMIYAQSEDEFNSILKDMQDSVKGLGYDEIYQVDLANAQAKQVDRDAMAAK